MEINNLKGMLANMKRKLDNQSNLNETLAEFRKRQREQEQRGFWSGRCPSCKTLNEVEKEDVRFASGFFGSPQGHYTRCLECDYNDVPVKHVKP
jgi:C4-type Zn-finger protein